MSPAPPFPDAAVAAIRPLLPASGDALFVTRWNLALADALRAASPGLRWEVLTKEDAKGRGGRWLAGRLRERSRSVVVLEDHAPEGLRRRDLYRLLLLAARTRVRVLVLGAGAGADSPGGVTPVRPLRDGIALAGSLALDAAAALAAVAEGLRLAAALRPRPRRPIPAAGSFAYLRTDYWFGTRAGGSVSHSLGFLAGARALGASPEVVGSEPLPLPEGIPQTTVAFPGRPRILEEGAMLLYNRRFAAAAVRRLRPRPPDVIVHRHSVFSVAGLLVARALDRPLVLEVNGLEVWIRRNWSRLHLAGLAERLERRVFAGADRITVVSEVLRRQLVERGVDPARIVVNPNGVDADRFDPGDRGGEVRERFGFAPDDVVVGFSGTFTRWHGAYFLAEQIGPLAAENPKLKFLLLGDGDLRSAAKERVRADGAAGACVFPGLVPYGRVPEHLAACDILVSPHLPLEDGSPFFFSPVKLYEYMAAGRAVVAAALGQIGEVLREGETGLLHPAGDAGAFRRAIRTAAADPDLRRRLGEAARAEAAGSYTWRDNAARVLAADG